MNAKTIYFRPLLRNIYVRANSGTETYQSSGLFTGGINGTKLPLCAPVSTPQMRASLLETIADGKFARIFQSLGENRMCWSEAQVIQFYRDTIYNDEYNIWSVIGPGISFELRGGYVSIIYFAAYHRPGVYNYLLAADINWRAKDFLRRVVSLQPWLCPVAQSIVLH